MIVSHSRKYIFFKNLKVGGTSIQRWLNRYYLNSDRDYIVGEYDGSDGTDSQPDPATDDDKPEINVISRKLIRDYNLFPPSDQHMTWGKAKTLFPVECSTYWKFSNVRNPWEATWSYACYVLLVGSHHRQTIRHVGNLPLLREKIAASRAWRDYLYDRIASGQKIDWPTLKFIGSLVPWRMCPTDPWQNQFVWESQTGEQFVDAVFRLEDMPDALLSLPFVDKAAIDKQPFVHVRTQGPRKPKAREALTQECIDKIAETNKKIIDTFKYELM